ncbi:MAG: DUF1080 domain-containing protein [Proteiniphilum sp.]|uniref:3-keto-disaccharide hydrolase n=1 Tax=Proteiniphilum sp. TaxID=1926877 RepID=UPI002ABC7A75|nr:DUF1080 domain-containing protein [Proteiniphilum sp.]MDY9919205.1 DUF1080 domain-containing protein [Proteiniphilum sp.]
MIIFSCHTNKAKEEAWISLLDKDLSQWRMYLSFEMKDDYDGSIPVDAEGNIMLPVGYDNNVKQVFSMIEIDKEPVLRISGEIYGCVFTKECFKNYHLRLKIKWGDKKWIPRINDPMDSGLLYHSQGECGVDYWRSWMLSHEFQLIDGSCGDYWCIGNTQVDIRARKEQNRLRFDPAADLIPFGVGTENNGYCVVNEVADKPKGEWNDIELICFEGKSLHIVNGAVVMALSNLRYQDGEQIKPLIEGKIQLQSEAAEVFYKDIQIKEIDHLPEIYDFYFN